MAVTQIRGSTQIMAGTVPWSVMAAGAIVPFASVIGSSNIILSTGAVSMGAVFNLGGYTAQNSGTPVNATDLVTKGYVDAKSGGIGGLHDVTAMATTNQSISAAPATLDGVTLVAGNVVLLTGQTTTTQNGPWTFVSSGSAMTRPSWWAAAATVNNGQYFMIAPGGASYADSKWWCTNVGTITVDTTATTFSQDLSGSTYSAGTGLTLTTGAFSVNYGTTSTTAAAGNDSRITGALSTASLGTSVATALGVAVGTAGGVLVNGGVLGTPSGGTLTNATGLPISTGISGLGTGVATALAVAGGTAAGVPILSGGYLVAANFPALTGDVTSVAGALGTTVNNTAGSGFVKYTNFITNETPSGSVNSVNATFTLANTPATCNAGGTSLELTLNGDTLENGSGNDFTLSGGTITMLTIPQTGDKLRAYYMK